MDLLKIAKKIRRETNLHPFKVCHWDKLDDVTQQRLLNAAAVAVDEFNRQQA